MNEPVPNRLNADAVPHENGVPPSAQPAPERPPFVRGRLAVCALVVVGLAAGYYAGRFARGVYLHPADAAGDMSAAEQAAHDASVPGHAPAGRLALVVDPDAPLPATVEVLHQETLAAVDALVGIFPDKPDALEMKARVLMWLGNSSQAEATWQQCLQREPKYIHAYVGMASAAAARAEHEKALELAQHALTLDANNFQARAIVADSLLQLGRAQEVPAVLEEHLSKDPRSRGYYLLGQAYAQTGDSAKARDNFEAAVRIFADYPEAYNGLAVAYEKLGEAEKSKQAMDRFRELGKKQEADPQRIREDTASDLAALKQEASALYTDAGRVLYVSKKPTEAEQFWLRAVALDDRNTPCRQALAWLCRSTHRRGENIAWLKQLAELEPANPSYWAEIGRVYEDLQLLPAAEDAFRKACQAAPEDDTGYAALADLLLRFGKDPAEAVEPAQGGAMPADSFEPRNSLGRAAPTGISPAPAARWTRR